MTAPGTRPYEDDPELGGSPLSDRDPDAVDDRGRRGDRPGGRRGGRARHLSGLRGRTRPSRARQLAAEHGLVEPDLARVASWWHTDSDLGRDIEVLADMSKSRLAGFTGFVRTSDAFLRLFDRYRADRVVPQLPA